MSYPYTDAHGRETYVVLEPEFMKALAFLAARRRVSGRKLLALIPRTAGNHTAHIKCWIMDAVLAVATQTDKPSLELSPADKLRVFRFPEGVVRPGAEMEP